MRVHTATTDRTGSEPPALLVRPDGIVAWAGGDGLDEALSTWFGSPRPAPDAPPVAAR